MSRRSTFPLPRLEPPGYAAITVLARRPRGGPTRTRAAVALAGVVALGVASAVAVYVAR